MDKSNARFGERGVLFAGRSRQSSSLKKGQFTKGKANYCEPCIERSRGACKWFSQLILELKAMSSYPLKLLEPIKKMRRSRSVQMVLEGEHDPKYEPKVQSFRQMLFLEGHLTGKHTDYETLLRFLKMGDFDEIKTKEAFMKYLRWREEYGVDVIPKEFKFDEYREVKKCYPHGFHGVDRFGRPLYIERIGMIDLTAFQNVTTIERFVKYHVSEQEKTLNWRYPACSIAAKKHISSTTSILDVKDVGISNFSKPARCIFMEIQKVDSNYYPETLHHLFIINAGSGFRALWKAVKAFLDQRTLAKIEVLGSNYKSRLLEVIDPSNLPTFLGGNCTCSDHGGCLMSDRGPWNDSEITDLLQGMLNIGAELGNRESNVVASREDLVSDMGDIQIKGKISTTVDDPRQVREAEAVDQLMIQKIPDFESALELAKMKIRTLEAALVETKLVLQALSQHIEDLKKT